MFEFQHKGQNFSRRTLLRRLGYVATAASVAGGVGYCASQEKNRLQLRRVGIPLSSAIRGLEGFKIALLADFHLYPHTTLELVREAVAMANRTQPDLVVLAGDYVLATADSVFDLSPVLQNLNSRLGTFAILGNHDHWRGAATVSRGLSQAGAELLRNRAVTLRWNSRNFVLGGVDDGWVGRQDLKTTLEGQTGGLPTLLMMHEPDFADEFSRDGRVHVQLSGHSHGGQVRFPLIGSPFLPPYGRKYDKGLYRVGDMMLYTSVGIGVTVPIRFNCPPEVTEITFGAGD